MGGAVPTAHNKVFDAIVKALKANGFPGGFLMLIQEDESGHTGVLGTVDGAEAARILQEAGKDIDNVVKGMGGPKH